MLARHAHPRTPALIMCRRRLVQLAALAGGVAALPACLAGCGSKTALALTATDLTASVRDGASPSASGEDAIDALSSDDARAASFSFATRLIQACSVEDRSQDPRANTFVSPLSVTYALALAQNGAAGSTLDELERAGGLATDELNAYLGAYASYLQTGDLWGNGNDAADGAMPLHLANSIWVRNSDTLTVRDAYLSACANELDASVFSAPFDDSTVSDINAWVDEHTAHMIDRLIDEIPRSVRLYLINALAFEDAWKDPFDEESIEDATFTCEDGLEQNIRLMRSHEGTYLENEQFQGFIKPYAAYRFAFVGLLPREGVALADAIAALDGPALEALLRPVASAEADVGLPAFRLSYTAELTDVLRALGIEAAFDADRADFTPMGTDEEGPLYIGQVLHKTFIDVNAQGTRAAAATSIGMSGASAAMEEPVVHEVILDRPFAYLIIDYQLGIPVFAGAMQTMPSA